MPCASRAGARPEAGATGPSAAPIGTSSRIPAGLRTWCVTESALRPGLPLWVVENGMATRVRDGRPVPREDGMDRPRYVREHLGAVADAVAAGVPVRAYLHWSLMDNYEWGTYEPRYGLFGVDRSDPAAVHFMDTDAQGDDAAGEFARVRAPVCAPGTARCWADRPERRRPSGRRAVASPGAAVSAGPSISSFALRWWRTTSTTITTRMSPRTMSDAMPVAFSTLCPTK